DAVLLRYAAQVNGCTEMVLTKLDILSGLDELNIAVAYDIDGERHEFPPATNEELEKATPIYETLPGWNEDITGARSVNDLPQAARDYIQRIAGLCEVPVNTVSVGPERDQLVHF
ncbi:MAG: adenylosuccinate synthetase, partial [Chloroflexota bacterium]